MGYQPIENYGLIGNMRTAALVGVDGSIDWLCWPHFDSPSLFAAILDDKKGGRFKIAPAEDGVTHKQFYWPDSNILVTRFLSQAGIGQVVDFMPVGLRRRDPSAYPLVRRVQAMRGSVTFRLECRPAFNYARDEHRTSVSDEGAMFTSGSLSVALISSIPLKPDGNGVRTEFTLQEGQTVAFILHQAEATLPPSISTFSDGEGEELFQQTVEYWRRWLGQCTYMGRWREVVHRSCLALKLLTFEPTGAIVAAPTCSLPEAIGGSRNWDYRYTWIRDAAFTIYALMRVGFTKEAGQFMHWLEDRCHELAPDGSLQIVYGINGRHQLNEETLDHLEGYKGSRPVRIGNNAYQQLQLDIYGELMDSVYLYNKYGSPISYDLWVHLRRLVNWTCDHWQEPDEGMWEVRSGRRHFVYSKLMAWVAVDRGLRLADKRSFPADRDRWIKVRDAIYEDIIAKGWNSSKQAFVQSYGSTILDASTLMIPLIFFLSPSDPRLLRTIDAIMEPPEKGGLLSNSLVYRYNVRQTLDGLDGEEGTFNICTFWLVEALTRAGKDDPARLQQARLIFEQMLGYASHLRLYAEETGNHGEALGNYPQAFTHLALISSAHNLDRTLSGKS